MGFLELPLGRVVIFIYQSNAHFQQISLVCFQIPISMFPSISISPLACSQESLVNYRILVVELNSEWPIAELFPTQVAGIGVESCFRSFVIPISVTFTALSSRISWIAIKEKSLPLKKEEFVNYTSRKSWDTKVVIWMLPINVGW